VTTNPAFPRVHIATDHAGMELSAHLVKHLTANGYDVVDHGPQEYDALDDYPSFCINAALAVVADQEAGIHALGIVLGGSGNGEQIAANKVKGVRAALCNCLYTARLARQHNDANVLSIGGRIVAPQLADEILTLWLTTPFDGGRHERRVAQIAEIEEG
jgi:ribose 5-phosphate isomerase B